MVPNPRASLRDAWYYYKLIQQRLPPPQRPPPPPLSQLPQMTLTLPTGELAVVPANFGHRWYHHWEPYAPHWNYLNLWYHTLVIQNLQGASSHFWKMIDSRFGYLGLTDPPFRMAFDIQNRWAIETPLSSGLRCHESLDLGTQSLRLSDLDAINSRCRSFGYGQKKILRPLLLKMSTDYMSTFVNRSVILFLTPLTREQKTKHDGDFIKVNLMPLSPASQHHLDTLLRYDEVYVLKQSFHFH
jgi:hypothetical protein